jgi:hypothetical protein
MVDDEIDRSRAGRGRVKASSWIRSKSLNSLTVGISGRRLKVDDEEGEGEGECGSGGFHGCCCAVNGGKYKEDVSVVNVESLPKVDIALLLLLLLLPVAAP